MGRLFHQLRWQASERPAVGNAQGGRKQLPKSKQPFYKRNNAFEFEASLQSLENELITDLMATIDNGCPTIAPFLSIMEKGIRI